MPLLQSEFFNGKKLLFGPSLVVTILPILSLSRILSLKKEILSFSLSKPQNFFIPLVISVP